jgi:hypothetical protein
MTTIRLTLAQRKQMRKLGSCVDGVTAGDRIFFKLHPQRRHRIRARHACAIAMNEIIDGEPLPLPPGLRRYTVVKNICPGTRLRLFFVGHDEDTAPDPGETIAQWIFERLVTPRELEMEAMLRKQPGRRRAQR